MPGTAQLEACSHIVSLFENIYDFRPHGNPSTSLGVANDIHAVHSATQEYVDTVNMSVLLIV